MASSSLPIKPSFSLALAGCQACRIHLNSIFEGMEGRAREASALPVHFAPKCCFSLVKKKDCMMVANIEEVVLK